MLRQMLITPDVSERPRRPAAPQNEILAVGERYDVVGRKRGIVVFAWTAGGPPAGRALGRAAMTLLPAVPRLVVSTGSA